MKSQTILENKSLVINPILFEVLKKFDFELNEFLLLLYFINDDSKLFDLKLISDYLKIPEKELLITFNSLLKKKVLTVETKKDSKNKMVEYINLNNLYLELDNQIDNDKIKEEKKNVYGIFESEFARPLSSMEYEIIRAWLEEKKYSEDLVIGALKEAVYNGVNNLRYIDKILYEWNKKGFKTSKDAEEYVKKGKESSKAKKELYDCDWINDDSEE